MRITSGETVLVIMAAAVAWCWHDQRRRHRREQAAQALDQAMRTFPQPPVTQAEADAGVDSMIDAIREQPGRGQRAKTGPPPSTPVPPPPPAGRRYGADFYRCGCTVTARDGTAWIPCPAHEAMAEVEARTEQA